MTRGDSIFIDMPDIHSEGGTRQLSVSVASLDSDQARDVRDQALQVIGVTRGQSIFNDMPSNIYDDIPLNDMFKDMSRYFSFDKK